MFLCKIKSMIDSLIGMFISIMGDVGFKGGLCIDGVIIGNINVEVGQFSVLVIFEYVKVVGEVCVVYLIVNGEIIGDVYFIELLELQFKVCIIGNVFYKVLEMYGGVLVFGKFSYDQQVEMLVLKLVVLLEV